MGSGLLLAAATVAAIVAPPPAGAQILPPIEISGFIDNVTASSRNLTDLDFTDRRDAEWFARTRGRLDIEARIGRARGVLGLEIDAAYGLTGFQDSAVTNQIQARGVADVDRRARNRGLGATGQMFGTTGAFDLNTDVLASLEVKWLYLEFPLPLLPRDVLVRVGAQPFAATYKVGSLATGDFAGLSLVTMLAPKARWHLAYAIVNERLSGAHVGDPLSRSGRLASTLDFFNGDDQALVTSVELTPVRGLDLRPTYAFFHAEGNTSAASRVPVGQLSPVAERAGAPPSSPTPTFCLPRPDCTGRGNRSATENRHTVGFDARWTAGAFSLRPTFFYQFGTREQVNPFTGAMERAAIDAMLLDVVGGYRHGPWLLELRGTYTSGNRPRDQLFRKVKYYQPINTDATFGADGWGNIFARGIDYLNGGIGTLGSGVGWDRYGRGQVGAKAVYSVTPAMDAYALAQGLWTARRVDVDQQLVAVQIPQPTVSDFGSVLVPGLAGGSEGDASRIGVEVNAGVTWRFAPGFTLDLVYAHLFAGPALDLQRGRPDGSTAARKSRDADAVAARVRFTF